LIFGQLADADDECSMRHPQQFDHLGSLLRRQARADRCSALRIACGFRLAYGRQIGGSELLEELGVLRQHLGDMDEDATQGEVVRGWAVDKRRVGDRAKRALELVVSRIEGGERDLARPFEPLGRGKH
jgi:hypothetical protein